MALLRSTRVGQTLSIPTLCDVVYQERLRHALESAGVAAYNAAIAAGAGEEEAGEMSTAAIQATVARLQDEHRRFGDTLDDSCLSLGVDGVDRVLVQGLSGAQFAEAESAGTKAHAKAKAEPADLPAYVECEILRRGLVNVAGFDEEPVGGMYPVEALMAPGGIGVTWAEFRREFAGRIKAWSHLGKSASPSSVP